MTAVTSEQLLKEARFQLDVTRAMLGTLELDQILYIILSGITHGEGMSFNRAILFLADTSGDLRASTAVGPADQAEAHRIWEEMEQQKLDLNLLLDRFDASLGDPRSRVLTRRLAGLVVKGSSEPPTLSPDGRQASIQDLISWCAGQKEPLYSNTLKVTYQPPGESGLEFTYLAVIPLRLKDKVLGVILADRHYTRSEVKPEDMRCLGTLGNLAAIAIEQASLHQRLKEMASLDGLTGVFNRRRYEERLEQEIGRARRSGTSLSMLLFDIDHFKACNDNFGHLCGDRVLKELAGILRKWVRAEDMVARYGGEEFVVLLTGGASQEEACRVAEKLRVEVESYSLGGRPPGTITVSAGVACLTSDTLDGSELFRLADKALYLAKQRGRNQVVLSSPTPS